MATPQKVLRYSLNAAETGFDPVRVSDEYSNTVIAHIIESPLTYDYLADPPVVVPRTAEALPEHSADFRTWTVRIRPGVYFADDPAFDGKRRELTAADYAYSLKRYYDPRWKSPIYTQYREKDLLGLEALRQRSLDTRRPFDYDAPVAGLELKDRYTLSIHLGRPDPQFLLNMANPNYFGAVAREVVERYGEDVDAHPVGTGPFKLAQWRRSSRIVLDRNPGFREERFDAQPAADDAAGQAWLARHKGDRLPMVDRIEFAIIEEAQPTWLSFLTRDFDLVRVPLEFAQIAVPGGKLAPNLAKQGVTLRKVLQGDHAYTYFNMDDPVVGGYTPDKVALRRAISLAYDNNLEISRVRRGLGIPATSMLVPHTLGYDASLDFGFSEYDPAKAKALLDLYGYVDKDGDGWRDLPDGKPMVLNYYSPGSETYRQFNELWAKAMKEINVRMVFVQGLWPDQFKQAQAGSLQIWGLGNTATSPDGSDFLHEAYGPEAGANNLPRFKLPAYDELVKRVDQLPDGPERHALLKQAQSLLAVYLPIKPHVHRIRLYLSQPWLTGYRTHPFALDFGRYVDVDAAKQAAAIR
ncbi:MAG TPA: ABC transporter substrate-binding protein [Ideonella sp.]|uniref:ABC transporter substrate-binding protein n=1 Tax=Ideonella sp. TaxID=1929293 RepID=UPI002B74C0B6|nr:ABC transporter substrate-binding protein [Ideonella sp.]HSI51965.1 ABC transporter substrate-binding protein [Ideonella sp.]